MNSKDKYLLKEIPETINTKRVTIRRYQRGDGEAIFCFAERNDNRKHLAGTADDIANLKSVEEAEVNALKHRAEWAIRDRFVAGVWIEEKFVGEIWIEPVNWDVPCFEIGWFIDKGLEAEGFAYEAADACVKFVFNELNAHKIIAKTSDTNERSSKLAVRLGFSEEGHLRDSEIKDGDRRGTLLYGYIRRDSK